jgi:hypothetical protein
LAQLAKKMQSSAQPAGNANRLSAELARPRIVPHPTKGTIEFEHGQNVAKLGKVNPIVNGPFHAMPFRPSPALRFDRIGGTHDRATRGKQGVTGKIA